MTALVSSKLTFKIINTIQPPRSAQATIKFTTVDSDPYIMENFPFDKYEIEILL